MRRCSWCNQLVWGGPCPHCSENIYSRPIPTNLEGKREEFQSLCEKLRAAARGERGLEVADGIILDRLEKLYGQPLAVEEILNPSEELENKWVLQSPSACPLEPVEDILPEKITVDVSILQQRALTVHTKRPQVLLVIDREGWAFHHIALQIKRYLSDEFDIEIIPIADVDKHPECSVMVAFWWASLPTLKKKVQFDSCVLCVYDSYAWTAEHVTSAERMNMALNDADVIAVGNESIAQLLTEKRQLPVYITEDGVDTTLFHPRPFPQEFRAGWTGNSQGAKQAAGIDDLKGVGIIREACRVADVPLDIRDYASGEVWEHERMPDWYAGTSVYICASSREGTPNPLLEAMSCGRPVIITDVGLTRRILAHGVNGYVVERSAEAITEAIVHVKKSDIDSMGRLARAAAECHDWRNKIQSWRACLRAAVEIARRKRDVQNG